MIYNIAALHAAKLLNDDAIPTEFAAEPKADRHPVVTYIDRASYYALRDAKRAARARGRTHNELWNGLSEYDLMFAHDGNGQEVKRTEKVWDTEEMDCSEPETVY